MSKYGKVHRQLYLYELIHTSQEVTMEEMIKKLGVCQKTIQRDITDLTDAGLIKLRYDRKDNVYSSEGGSGILVAKKGTSRYLYLQKLRRLAIFLEELSDATYYSYSDNFNCKKRYRELFPEVSERTRFRDYRTLSGMGFSIRWDAFDKCHSIDKYYDIHENEEF
ncbi:MAG: HTH domain-containing protein [Lachnospiraceae bacterium]|nr:HTH domain-containing protein [Lachnospiraceae bacterium]